MTLCPALCFTQQLSPASSPVTDFTLWPLLCPCSKQNPGQLPAFLSPCRCMQRCGRHDGGEQVLSCWANPLLTPVLPLLTQVALPGCRVMLCERA